MTLMETMPAMVSMRAEYQRGYWGVNGVGTYREKVDVVKTYSWACELDSPDDSTPPATHEATYATGGFELDGYSIDVPHNKLKGYWIEYYRNVGAWVDKP